jgi:hypothetical protein
MAKTLKVDNPSKLKTIDYRELKDLQTDFKTLPPEKLERLKSVLVDNGWYFPMFVWFGKSEQAWTIDGHQRMKALASLESEGWQIPQVPYVEITAANKKDAARKLLYFNARYGQMNPTTSFFDDFNLDVADFEIEFDDLFIDFNPDVFENPDPKPSNRVTPSGDNKIIAIGTLSSFCRREAVIKLERLVGERFDAINDEYWGNAFAKWLTERLENDQA